MVVTLKYKLWCDHMILYMRSYFMFQAHSLFALTTFYIHYHIGNVYLQSTGTPNLLVKLHKCNTFKTHHQKQNPTKNKV
jgi:hypothetical protein